MKEETIELEGEIVGELGFGNYSVQVPGIAHTIIAYRSGKMKLNKIALIIGDKVLVKINPDDRSKGIIAFRLKNIPGK